MYPKVYLKEGKDQALLRKHPWIFSGAIKNLNADLHNKLVYVCNAKGNILATGYYQDSSITVKILEFKEVEINQEFWNYKIGKAYNYRKAMNCFNTDTNSYRLVFAEADGLPGLIIDNYNGHCVMQAHTEFIHHHRFEIESAVQYALQDKYQSFYDKSEWANDTSDTHDTIIQENGLSFYVNWKEGQKTGFFLDQKNNRNKLKTYCSNKTILNTFSYSGGFSVYALAGAAKHVDSVDISAKAIEWCNQNVKLNQYSERHQAHVSDIFDFLKNSKDNFYDIIVLDPPAFAKSMHHKHSAVQAYKRLNIMAMNKIKKGGLLFTFSCSGVIDKQLFHSTTQSAAFEVKRDIKLIDHMYLPIDHPVLPYFPEGDYLKGEVLYVD